MDSVCPHLGVPGDKELRYGYPTDLNVCYADQPGWGKFRPVEKSHQRQFCLAGDQILCPVYLRQLATPERGKQRKQAKTYCEFFGLRREPFSIVPHSHFLCKSQSQAQAHRGLRWLIDNHQGLGLLLGPVGTGKTLLCRAQHPTEGLAVITCRAAAGGKAVRQIELGLGQASLGGTPVPKYRSRGILWETDQTMIEGRSQVELRPAIT